MAVGIDRTRPLPGDAGELGGAAPAELHGTGCVVTERIRDGLVRVELLEDPPRSLLVPPSWIENLRPRRPSDHLDVSVAWGILARIRAGCRELRAARDAARRWTPLEGPAGISDPSSIEGPTRDLEALARDLQRWLRENAGDGSPPPAPGGTAT